MSTPDDLKHAEHDLVLLECVDRTTVLAGGLAAMLLHWEASGVKLSAEEAHRVCNAFHAGAHHVFASFDRVPKDKIPRLYASLQLEFDRFYQTIADEHAREVAAFDAKFRNESDGRPH